MASGNSSLKLPKTTSILPLTLRPRILQTPWLGGTNSLLLQSTILRPHHEKVRLLAAAAVSFSLPTAKPETGSSVEKVPKWSRRAMKSFSMAELEARKLKYPTTGTEALLMGILNEDMYFFSPEHPPSTEDAQRALDWAIDKKIKSRDSGEMTTSYLLLGIWSEVNSPGHKIMATLLFSDEKAMELESLSFEPRFDDD